MCVAKKECGILSHLYLFKAVDKRWTGCWQSAGKENSTQMLLFDEQLYVNMPESFQEMSQDRIDALYPYEVKQEIILESTQTGSFCTFSLFEDQGIMDSQVEYAIHSAFKIVTRLYPSCLLKEDQIMSCAEAPCGWFAFKTIAAEGALYNVMYIFPVNGHMMFGTMGCRMEDEQGKEQLMEIMRSLKAQKRKRK